MVVFVMEKVNKSLRGYVSRYSIEVSAGVFVCKISRRVRELLWQEIVKKVKDGKAVMVWSSNNEQGYDFAMIGYKNKSVVDFDGIKLIKNVKNS